MRKSPWLSALALVITIAPACRTSKSDHTDESTAKRTPMVAADASAGQRRIFVTNYQADTISVVEGTPELEIATLQSGSGPHGMAIRPTEPRLLAVAISAGFDVELWDPDTLKKVGEVKDVVRGPQDVVFSRDGKTLFVCGTSGQRVCYIDVDTRTKVGECNVFDARPRRILLSPDGRSLYVLLVSGGDGTKARVAVLDIASRKVTKEIPIEKFPHSMAIGNNDRYLVTDSFDLSKVTVIDIATLEVIAVHDSPTGMGLAVHPTKPLAYPMGSFDDEFHVLDLESGKVLETIRAGGWPTYPEVSPDKRYLYIPHEESDSLVKLDLETHKVVMKSVVGSEPIEVAIYDR